MALAARPTFSDPAYGVRLSINANVAAGAAAQGAPKFAAHAALLLFSLTGFLVNAGTSTYTNTVTGVGTATINAHQLSVIVITNTATTGQVATTTATYGPFLIGGTFASGGTGTAAAGGWNQFALNTATGTTGYGGIPVPQGSEVYVVSGTDATASSAVTIDYQLAPLAGLTL